MCRTGLGMCLAPARLSPLSEVSTRVDENCCCFAEDESLFGEGPGSRKGTASHYGDSRELRAMTQIEMEWCDVPSTTSHLM